MLTTVVYMLQKQLHVSAIEYRRYQVSWKNKMEVFTFAWWEMSKPYIY